jgi:hypothetical protein
MRRKSFFVILVAMTGIFTCASVSGQDDYFKDRDDTMPPTTILEKASGDETTTPLSTILPKKKHGRTKVSEDIEKNLEPDTPKIAVPMDVKKAEAERKER